MTNSLTRIAVLLFAAATVAPALHAAEPGSRIALEALPSYVQRVFVPVVPQAKNTLDIATLRAEEVLEAPKEFDVRIVNGAVVVYSDGGDAAGYAKVRAGGRELTLTLVNVVPYGAMQNGRLEGYKVGEYNPVPLKGLEQYERPKGFIRLGNDNSNLMVSDHYRMRDFQCKLDGTTKFLVLRTDALVKLEILQHELETKHGLDFDRFTIMSGYRTPYYNAKIGNETGYSRHLYGDAMDVFIDQNRDGNMDDVNRDGRVDTADARFLLRVAEEIDNSEEWGWLKGGAGVYHANAAHGPYVHIDARGYVARWGALEEPASGTRGASTVAARR
jgi:Peptidase M15